MVIRDRFDSKVLDTISSCYVDSNRGSYKQNSTKMPLEAKVRLHGPSEIRKRRSIEVRMLSVPVSLVPNVP